MACKLQHAETWKHGGSLSRNRSFNARKKTSSAGERWWIGNCAWPQSALKTGCLSLLLHNHFSSIIVHLVPWKFCQTCTIDVARNVSQLELRCYWDLQCIPCRILLHTIKTKNEMWLSVLSVKLHKNSSYYYCFFFFLEKFLELPADRRMRPSAPGSTKAPYPHIALPCRKLKWLQKEIMRSGVRKSRSPTMPS